MLLTLPLTNYRIIPHSCCVIYNLYCYSYTFSWQLINSSVKNKIKCIAIIAGLKFLMTMREAWHVKHPLTPNQKNNWNIGANKTSDKFIPTMCLVKLINIKWNCFLIPVVLSGLSLSVTAEMIIQGHTTIPLIRCLGLLHTTWIYEEYYREHNFRSIGVGMWKRSQNLSYLSQ